uniref:Uncharacterized protein n=1 Tax=Peronospora matthiolae TaxID=2874970 RepID=A0AAV1UN30_9STRA
MVEEEPRVSDLQFVGLSTYHAFARSRGRAALDFSHAGGKQ